MDAVTVARPAAVTRTAHATTRYARRHCATTTTAMQADDCQSSGLPKGGAQARATGDHQGHGPGAWAVLVTPSVHPPENSYAEVCDTRGKLKG